jgi:hypothetical protein
MSVMKQRRGQRDDAQTPPHDVLMSEMVAAVVAPIVDAVAERDGAGCARPGPPRPRQGGRDERIEQSDDPCSHRDRFELQPDEAEMTLSVHYWRLPEEETDLATRLQEEPGIVATPNELVESAKKIVWKPLAKVLVGKHDSFLITLPELVPQMKITRVGSWRGLAAGCTRLKTGSSTPI